MKKAGYTLIEVLISSSLIFFLLAGTAHLTLSAMAAKRTADFLFAASSLALSRLESLKALPFDHPDLKTPNSSEIVRSSVPGIILLFERTVEDVNERLKKVIVTVSLQTRPSRKTMFSLFLCRELDF